MKKHDDTHKDEMFPTGCEMMEHEQTHSEKQFSCNDCDKVFTKINQLESHKAQIHQTESNFGFARD